MICHYQELFSRSCPGPNQWVQICVDNLQSPSQPALEIVKPRQWTRISESDIVLQLNPNFNSSLLMYCSSENAPRYSEQYQSFTRWTPDSKGSKTFKIYTTDSFNRCSMTPKLLILVSFHLRYFRPKPPRGCLVYRLKTFSKNLP